MLTEENCKDVEKIARLLQVDSVIKCVSDFYKCLSAKTGANIDDKYKYSSFDLMEFKHVRSSGIQKTLSETALKRGGDVGRSSSPGNKRQRMHRGPSPNVDMSGRSGHRTDDALSMAHSYGGSSWDGRGGARVPPQPGVIDIVEDSIEIIQTDQNQKDAYGNPKADGRKKSVSIAVSSQYNTPTDLQVVNMTDPGGTNARSQDPSHSANARSSITVSPLPMFSDSASPSHLSQDRTSDSQGEFSSVRVNPPSQPVFPTLTPMQRGPTAAHGKSFSAGSGGQSQSKPFAAGSANQATSSPQPRKSSEKSVSDTPSQSPGLMSKDSDKG